MHLPQTLLSLVFGFAWPTTILQILQRKFILYKINPFLIASFVDIPNKQEVHNFEFELLFLNLPQF